MTVIIYPTGSKLNTIYSYQCRVVSGWEWIYGTQKNPPIAIQMDGETGGNKVVFF